MPTPDQIREQLTSLTSLGSTVAVLWHLAMIIILAGLWSGFFQPSRRLAAMLTPVPLVSASVLAFGIGNPFNGLVLGGAAVVLFLLGARLSTLTAEGSPPWAMAVGSASIVFALIYPHFTNTTWQQLFWVAPLGVIPCPSIALVLGLGLLGGGFGSRAWSAIAVLLGTFYGLFGMLRLGVWLDVGLLVAAIALGVLVFVPFRRSHGSHPPPLQGVMH